MIYNFIINFNYKIINIIIIIIIFLIVLKYK